MNVRVLSAAALLGAAACNSDSAPDAAAAPAGRGGAAAGAAGGPAAGRGGRGATLTLAATDVSIVQRGTIEDVTAISGDLRPIETITVRSRIEGDVDVVSAREGDVVRPGQLLVQFDAEDQQSALRSAEADVAAARSDLANAQWNAEQSAQLFKAGAIAERDNKSAQQAVTTMQARLAAAESRLRTTANLMRDTRVLSPTTGVIDKREVEAGEHVSRGATLFSIVRNDLLELAAAMPARGATSVRVGQPVRFVADGKDFAGRIARVSPTVDPVTRSVTVYAQIPNPSGALRGGTFATGQVVNRTLSDVVAIPREALHQSQNNPMPFVYRIVDDVVQIASVRTGTVDERANRVEITEGLEPGDRIITGNVGNIGRGMRVTIAGTGEGGRGGSGRGRSGTP